MAALNGDEATAREIESKLGDLNRLLFIESNPIPVKWALQQMNLAGSGIRLPLVPLNSDYHEQVRAALKKAGSLA